VSGVESRLVTNGVGAGFPGEEDIGSLVLVSPPD
jgi:hypothetical protein